MPTPILQFGTSRFLQAHVDLFVSQAMDDGQDVGPITIVQSSGDAARAKRLMGLVGSYPVRIEGIENGQKMQENLTVHSVARALSTANDWAEIERIFVEEAQYVLSNTGDSGYVPSPSDNLGVFHQDMSYPGKLLVLLRARFAAGGKPIQIMPMELIVDNGVVLKTRIMELVENESEELKDYLNSGVIWANSLVDRIVSEPLEPAGAVAEPYGLWAVETQDGLTLPCQHEGIKLVKSLAEIEALKLFVLNLGHTFLANRWLQAKGADDVLVRDLMNSAEETGALNKVLAEEVRPAFVAAGLEDQFDPYVAITLERFANPYLAHKIADISQNHTQKVARRIGAMIDWARSQGDVTPKPVLAEIVSANS